MNPQKWKVLGSKEVLNHPRMHLVEDEVELPDGKVANYLRHAPVKNHSVAVIAINSDNQVLLQREYSYPPDAIMWQLPGGSANQGEDVVEAAKRELSEESGLTAKSCRIIGFFYTNNRRSDEKQYVVACIDLSPLPGQKDPEEFIENNWIPVDELKTRVAKGEFENINLLAALNIWFCQS